MKCNCCCNHFVEIKTNPLAIICLLKYKFLFYIVCTDNGQNRSISLAKEVSNMETHLTYSHLQIPQESAVTASLLSVPNKEVRQTESFNFPTLSNSTAISDEVKKEVTDQGRFTFFSVQISFLI